MTMSMSASRAVANTIGNSACCERNNRHSVKPSMSARPASSNTRSGLNSAANPATSAPRLCNVTPNPCASRASCIAVPIAASSSTSKMFH